MNGITIIGPGRLGGALAIALARAGAQVDRVVYRSEANVRSIADAMSGRPPLLTPFNGLEAIGSPVVIISTADPEIGPVAKSVAPFVRPGSIVLHTSGSLSSRVIAEAFADGAVGSMHPLVSVSDAVLGADRFRGAYFCIEGDTRAAEAAEIIARKLGGQPFSIPTELKPLYHASAVTASGHVVALFAAAVEMLSACGLDAGTAQKVLMPLLASTVENLRTQTPAEALTGTFARADVAAFDAHMAAIGQGTPGVAELYLELAGRSLDLAEERGVDAERVAEMRKRISIAKRKGG
jgi:predicted short-subunit dehydrogenase-like oxidoreductase (DUF2520 family)